MIRLLVVGDGIREGVEGIAEFLSNAGNFTFSLAMIELAIFEHEAIGQIVIPRIITKTVELQRYVVELPPGLQIQEAAGYQSDNSPDVLTPNQKKEKAFYQMFWREFINNLTLDDPGQLLPEPHKSQNQFFYLPPRKQTWISAYFMNSQNRVGVYFRCSNSQIGQQISERLEADKETILKELGNDVIWDMLENNGGAGVRLNCEDVFSPDSRNEINDFFQEWVNKLVNTFRPRLKRISDDLNL